MFSVTSLLLPLPANSALGASRAEGSRAGDVVAEALTRTVTPVSLNWCQVVTAAPQRFQVDILPVDDGTPRVVTNLGLQ